MEHDYDLAGGDVENDVTEHITASAGLLLDGDIISDIRDSRHLLIYCVLEKITWRKRRCENY